MSHQPTEQAAPSHGIIPAGMKCSICLEDIVDDNQKGISKLPCGHFFHLACIGSAFNVRRAMVCPNCRDFEDSEWRCFQREEVACRHNLPTSDAEEISDDDDDDDDEDEDEDEDEEEEEEEKGNHDDGETYQENNTHVMRQGIVPSSFINYNNNAHALHLNLQATTSLRVQLMQAERMYGPPPHIRMVQMPSFGDGTHNMVIPLVQFRQHRYMGLPMNESGSIGFQANNPSAMGLLNNLDHHNRLLQNLNGFGISAHGGISNHPNSWPYLNIQQPSHNLPSSSTPQGLYGSRGLQSTTYTPEALNHGSSSSTAAADPPLLGLNMSIGGGSLYRN